MVTAGAAACCGDDDDDIVVGRMGWVIINRFEVEKYRSFNIDIILAFLSSFVSGSCGLLLLLLLLVWGLVVVW